MPPLLRNASRCEHCVAGLARAFLVRTFFAATGAAPVVIPCAGWLPRTTLMREKPKKSGGDGPFSVLSCSGKQKAEQG